MADEATNKLRQYCIPDDPADEDSFGVHTRIAEAMMRVVHGAAWQGRSIALTGPWGSGKSTVVRQLQLLLNRRSQSQNDGTRLFLFDAWVHQGDPLRRSFLERLIEFGGTWLPGGREKDVQSWKDELDTVTGRRETTRASAERPLSLPALLFALSLFICLPVGSALLGRYDSTKQSFWGTPFGLAGILLMLVPPVFALTIWAKGGLQKMAAAAIRDLHQDTETTTVRTREASSTDFQNLFARIATAVLTDQNRRLIIVIDNLDRVDPGSAVTMWTTMRSFFESGSDECRRRVWLIVPFDQLALHQLWRKAVTHHANEEAQFESFIGKTFQINFDIPPILIAQLRVYFEAQMKKIFDPPDVERYLDALYRIFRLMGPSTPTPRDVKSFLNKLRGQALFWTGFDEVKDRVLLPCLAVHTLTANRLRDDEATLVRDDFLEVSVDSLLVQAVAAAKEEFRKRLLHGITPEVGDWRQQIAAAHFKVPPREALQPLLAGRFAMAFQSGDYSKLSEVRTQDYFPVVLKAYMDAQRAEWRRSPALLINAVKFVNSYRKEVPSDHADDIWRDLVRDVAEVRDWKPVDSRRLGGIKSVLRSRSCSQQMAQGIASSLMAAVSINELNVSLASWFDALDDTVVMLRACLGDAFMADRVPFQDPDVFVRAHLIARDQRPTSTTPHLFFIADREGVARSFGEAALQIPPNDFAQMRDIIVDGTGCTYEALNAAVINSPRLQLADKLDRLLQRPMPDAAELMSSHLEQILSLAGSSPDPKAVAATMVLASAEAADSRWANLKLPSYTPPFIGGIASALLAWKRSDVICDERWLDPRPGSMTQRLLDWVISAGRLAELGRQPVARILPQLQHLPETAIPLRSLVGGQTP